MKPMTSAFLLRVERYCDLSADQRQVLERFESDVEKRKKRTPVFDPARPDARLAIVRSGWAVSRLTSGSSNTTISHIYMPGDVIGVGSLGMAQLSEEVVMQTDGAVSLVDRDDVSRLGERFPLLLGVLLALSNLDDAMLRDRLHAITRLSAEDRLIHFILSIKARLAQSTEQPSDRFPLHLSQRDIGDALGLTDIYVNRLMRKLLSNGQIEISRPYLRITDRSGWERRVGFKDRFAEIDANWMAKAS